MGTDGYFLVDFTIVAVYVSQTTVENTINPNFHTIHHKNSKSTTQKMILCLSIMINIDSDHPISSRSNRSNHSFYNAVDGRKIYSQLAYSTFVYNHSNYHSLASEL
jgi:hypothetical protein